MIELGITLQDVDQVYQRMGLNELVVIPWLEYTRFEVILAGLMTGFIGEYRPFLGSKSAFLEHFIVLPEAPNKLRVMQQMPKLAATLLAGKVERILLSIAHDERRNGLGAWARRCGYTKFGELDSFDWYIKPLQERASREDASKKGESHGQERPEDARSAGSDAATAATASPGSTASASCDRFGQPW